MQVERAQISENGRIVIPAAYRKAMGLKGGEVLTISLDEDGLHIQSQHQAIARARALVRKYVPSDVCLVNDLLAERRREASLEESGS